MSVTVHDEDLVLQELSVFIRNNDILTITERNVTTITDTFTGDGTTTIFTLSQTTIKNVREVKVNSIVQTFGTDYLIDYVNNKITFTTAPNNTLSITIKFDYGTDAIFDGSARIDLKLLSYPRIAIDTTAVNIEDGSVDGNVNYTEYLISFYSYANGSKKVRDLYKKIKESILNNKKQFYYLKYITPISGTGVIQEPNRHDKILTKVLECRAPWNEEIIT